MREAIKLMFIPITGCIAIALIFLFVVIGGKFEGFVVNKAGMAGLAVAELEAHDGVFTDTGECDYDLYSPVCGFDGATYDNACIAVKAGTKVAHRGQCGTR